MAGVCRPDLRRPLAPLLRLCRPQQLGQRSRAELLDDGSRLDPPLTLQASHKIEPDARPAMERPEPRQHVAQGIDRGADRFGTTLHEIDVFRVGERLAKQPLVNRRRAAERQSVSEKGLTEDLAERASDDEILFDLPRLSPRRRDAPRLDVGPWNHASSSTGKFSWSLQVASSTWPTLSARLGTCAPTGRAASTTWPARRAVAPRPCRTTASLLAPIDQSRLARRSADVDAPRRVAVALPSPAPLQFRVRRRLPCAAPDVHHQHRLGGIIDAEEDAVDVRLPAVVQHAHRRFGIKVLRGNRASRRVARERQNGPLQTVEPLRALMRGTLDDPEVQLLELGLRVPRDLNAVRCASDAAG